MVRQLPPMLLAWLMFVPVALGANVSVNLAPARLEVGQSATYAVIVSGGQPANPPEVTAPDGVHVELVERRQSFSSTPRGIENRYRFGYRITALETGDHPIGPANVLLVDGTSAFGKQMTLHVLPRGAVPRPKDDLEVNTGFSREEIWEGEVVNYQADLTSRLPVQDVDWRLPPFEGLQWAPHGEESRTRTVVGDPDGDLTILHTVIPLVANGTGDRSQPPATGRVAILGQRDGFLPFARRTTKNVVGQRAPLTVKPLPTPPPEFSGLVGEFELVSRLGKTGAVRVGESVPWVLRIAGNGVLDGFDLELPDIPGVQVYQDGEQVVGRMTDGAYSAQKTFRMVLVPTDGGELPLPEVPVTVFDPNKGAYVTLSFPASQLDVRGQGEKVEIETFGVDGPAPEAFEPVDVRGVFTWGFATTPPLAPTVPLLLGLFGFPGMALLILDVIRGTRRWVGDRLDAARSTGPTGAARLNHLPDEPVERLRILDLALREALAARVGCEVNQLDRDAALDSLPRADQVRHAFQLLDEARFGGAAPASDLEDHVREALGVLK